MTMPENEEFIEDEPQTMDADDKYAVAVRIVENAAKITRTAVADFGSWVTYPFSAATPGPTPVLNRNVRRRRATLIVAATVAAQIDSDGVLIGTPGQCSAGKGGFLPIGIRITIENQQQLYAVYPASNANPVNLTVLDELYYSE